MSAAEFVTRLFGELPSLSSPRSTARSFRHFWISFCRSTSGELDQAQLPHPLELKYRAVSDAALAVGGVAKIRDAFVGFQAHLYAP